MMMILSLTIYAAALMTVMGVMALTLWPALPRIMAILSGTEQSHVLQVARRTDRRRVVRVSMMSSMSAPPAWRAAA